MENEVSTEKTMTTNQTTFEAGSKDNPLKTAQVRTDSENVKVFENNKFGKIRTIIINEVPWFIAKDIADILEYRTAPDMTRNLDDDETLIRSLCVSGQGRETTVINESGLYHAVIGSRKQEAKEFRKWVTSEVLPSIRKTGSYSLNMPKTFSEALRLAANQQEQIEKQSALLIEQKPKVEFYEAVAGSKDAIDIGNVAKVLNNGTGRNRLFEILRNRHVLQNNNVPYQKYIDAGYFRVIEQKYATNDGTVHINIKTLVYQTGVDFIRKICAENK